MTGAAGWRGQAGAWLAARSLRQILLGTGALALVVSGAFGGLRETEPELPAPLRAGVEQVSNPLEITVRRVRWTDDLGESIGPSERGRYLVVFADVSTTQDTSVDSFVVRESLRFRGLDGFAKGPFNDDLVASEDADPQVLVTADRVRLGEIGPGLSYEVAFVWEQATAEPLPTTVTLMTRAHEFRQSSLDDQSNWFGVSDDAVGRFTVERLESA